MLYKTRRETENITKIFEYIAMVYALDKGAIIPGWSFEDYKRQN